MMNSLQYTLPIHHGYVKNICPTKTDVEEFTPIMDDDEN
jgi:hypothetical protein